MTMTDTELAAFHEKLSQLRAAGKESDAKALLIAELPNLPEALGAEIMIEMFTDALEQQAEGEASIRGIQEEGIAAVDELLEKRNSS
jgi:hypothetical protein